MSSVRASAMAAAIWANLGLAQCNAGHNGGDRMDAHGVEFHNVELHERLTGSYIRSCNIYRQWVCCPSCVCEESMAMDGVWSNILRPSLLAYTILRIK